MKNLFYITTVFLGSLAMSSCSTQSPINSANVASLIQKEEFTFVAERANPSGSTVTDIMNSLPGTNSGRLLNLDPGYTIEIKKDSLEVTLPYFGRMYTPAMDPSKNSYRFTSTDYSMVRSDGKKGTSVFTINTKDQQNPAQIVIQVFNSGKTYVSIDSNDRQSISYDGYITENRKPKK